MADSALTDAERRFLLELEARHNETNLVRVSAPFCAPRAVVGRSSSPRSWSGERHVINVPSRPALVRQASALVQLELTPVEYAKRKRNVEVSELAGIGTVTCCQPALAPIQPGLPSTWKLFGSRQFPAPRDGLMSTVPGYAGVGVTCVHVELSVETSRIPPSNQVEPDTVPVQKSY